jgi:acyl-CoA thioesterase-1
MAVGTLATVVVIAVAFASVPGASSTEGYIEPPSPTPRPTVEPLVVAHAGDAPMRVLFAGDSLSGGYFASVREAGYDSLVTAAIGNTEPTSVVLNQGALITVGRIVQVPSDLGFAVIELGTNDVGRTDLAEFTALYGDLADSIHAASPGVALVCLSVWRSDGAEYDRVIEAACEAAGGRYIPLGTLYARGALKGPAGVATFRGQSDDFHPNDAGHRAIADRILGFIAIS